MTGENHPELALIDSNIGLILHAVGEYDISLRFLEKALALNIAYHGPRFSFTKDPKELYSNVFL